MHEDRFHPGKLIALLTMRKRKKFGVLTIESSDSFRRVKGRPTAFEGPTTSPADKLSSRRPPYRILRNTSPIAISSDAMVNGL